MEIMSPLFRKVLFLRDSAFFFKKNLLSKHQGEFFDTSNKERLWL